MSEIVNCTWLGLRRAPSTNLLASACTPLALTVDYLLGEPPSAPRCLGKSPRAFLLYPRRLIQSPSIWTFISRCLHHLSHLEAEFISDYMQLGRMFKLATNMVYESHGVRVLFGLESFSALFLVFVERIHSKGTTLKFNFIKHTTIWFSVVGDQDRA